MQAWSSNLPGSRVATSIPSPPTLAATIFANKTSDYAALLFSFTNGQYGGDDSGSGYGYPQSSSTSTSKWTSTSSPPSTSATSPASNSDVPFSSYVYDNAGNGGEITVAINVPSSSSDSLYFHVTAPAKQSWVAWGIGASMTDSSLVFLAYRSSDGKSITLSPRLATQHSEPQYLPVRSVNIKVLEGSGISNGMIVINAMCSNCRSWTGNSINVKSTSQAMILATYANSGGDTFIQSDDLSSSISQHNAYSQFTINLVQATGNGGVPSGSYGGSKSGSSSGGSSHHLARTIHAIVMLASFLFLYPLGVIYLRILEKVWLHWLNQTLATLCIVVAAAIGIGISIQQEISPNLNSTHQIVGLAALGLVLVQLTFGFIHHRIYARTKRPTPLGRIHRFAGPFVISLGLVNGYLGFRFAHESRYYIPYGVLVLVVAVVLALALFWKARRNSRRKGAGGGGRPGRPLNRDYMPQDSSEDIPLTAHRDASPYGRVDGSDAPQGQVFGRDGQAYYDPPPRSL